MWLKLGYWTRETERNEVRWLRERERKEIVTKTGWDGGNERNKVRWLLERKRLTKTLSEREREMKSDGCEKERERKKDYN